MAKQLKLSIVILRGGYEDPVLLKKCKDSVSWADEIIEVDTKNIKGGWSAWRNEGLKLSNGRWLLYVDTDEVIPEELRKEMELIINATQDVDSAYAIPRRNYIFGKEFKHSGQYPDYQIRLFMRNKLIAWEGDLHEQPKFEGSLGYFKNPLLHHKNITLSQMVEKTNKWSEIEGKLMYDAHHPPMNFLRFASAAVREFWLRMITQKAFLDGTEGVIYAIYQVYSRLISYSKLWELQLNNESSNI